MQPGCFGFIVSSTFGLLPSRPEANSSISLTFEDATTRLPLVIFTPTSVTLRLGRPVLHRIAGWYREPQDDDGSGDDSSGSGAEADDARPLTFTYSSVTATITFEAGSQRVPVILPMEYIFPYVAVTSPALAAVRPYGVHGRAAGQTFVEFRVQISPDLRITAAQAALEMVDSPLLYPVGLDVVTLQPQHLSLDPLASPLATDSVRTNFQLQALISQPFGFPGDQAFVLVYLVFNDGSDMLLRPGDLGDQLELESLRPELVQLHDDATGLSITNNSHWTHDQGYWLRAMLRGADTGVVAQGLGWIQLQRTAPDEIRVSITHPTLARPNSTAALFYPSFSSLRVQLWYASRGLLLDVTGTDQVQVDISNPAVATLLWTPGTAQLLARALGRVNITVRTDEVEKIVQVEVVRVVNIDVRALPHPRLPGAPAVTVLSRYNGTEQWQQAELVLEAELSNGETRDLGPFVTLGESVRVEPDHVARLTSDSDARVFVEPQLQAADAPANLTIVVDLAPGKTLKMALPWEPVTLVSIDSLAMVPATAVLQGPAGTSFPVAVQGTFSDGSVVPDLIEQGLESLISLVSTTEAVQASSTFFRLVANAPDQVLLQAEAPGIVPAVVQVACNLEPDFGDMDLGQRNAAPVPGGAVGQLMWNCESTQRECRWAPLTSPCASTPRGCASTRSSQRFPMAPLAGWPRQTGRARCSSAALPR